MGKVKLMKDDTNLKRLTSDDFYLDESNDDLAENHVMVNFFASKGKSADIGSPFSLRSLTSLSIA